MIKNLIATLIGKTLAKKWNLIDDTQETVPAPGTPVTKVAWYQSKAKISAILMVLVIGVQKLSPAFGHPIIIPDEVFKVLEALGIYGLRDAIKTSASASE